MSDLWDGPDPWREDFDDPFADWEDIEMGDGITQRQKKDDKESKESEERIRAADMRKMRRDSILREKKSHEKKLKKIDKENTDYRVRRKYKDAQNTIWQMNRELREINNEEMKERALEKKYREKKAAAKKAKENWVEDKVEEEEEEEEYKKDLKQQKKKKKKKKVNKPVKKPRRTPEEPEDPAKEIFESNPELKALKKDMDEMQNLKDHHDQREREKQKRIKKAKKEGRMVDEDGFTPPEPTKQKHKYRDYDAEEKYVDAKKCADDQFKCKTGECISIRNKCDKKKDCSDGSDEANCFVSQEKSDSKIPRHKDAPKEVPRNFICPHNLFTCHNKECILPKYKCDSSKDCSDGSDEWNC